MRSYCRQQSQSGFTMLEALLTLFILTIGILGVAGLQMRSMNSGGMASQRMIVVLKTQEILERMRANVGYGSSEFYKGDSSVPRNNLLAYDGAVGSGADVCNDGTTVCTPAQQAAFDIFMWQTDLAAALPDLDTGSGSTVSTAISVTAAASQNMPYTVTVTVSWADRNTSQQAGQDNLSYATSLQI